MVFPVVMYGCESWTIKKAKGQRIDAFELWCWRQLLRVPSTTRKSNQSILKEINPEYSLKGLKLKLQYFWPPDMMNWLFRKDPDAGKDWRQENKGTTEDEMLGWYPWLNGHEFEQAPGDGEGQRSLVCCSPWGHKESDMTWRLNINNSSSAYKSDKQRNNIQPWCVPFPILNQSTVPCPVLTVASWPAYRFLRRQVRWSGIPISLRILYRKRRDKKAFLSEQCKKKKKKGGKQ